MQRRRFRLLLNILDHLPRSSYFYAAMANDDDHAKQVIAALGGRPPESKGMTSPPLTNWTPDVEYLAMAVDAIRALEATISAGFGAKGVQRPKPLPRPSTAMQRALTNWQMDKHYSLVARVRAAQAAEEARIAAEQEADPVHSEQPDVQG